ncbi:MAG: WbqC family protein [Chitinophagales bacterium]|nr:WbqC family protein [Chitinophagaceae bacterium]MCB9064638.1 WbqC family protein [Chitinophagales bacterium]
MIVSIHQPSYFPWLGWLHKVNSSDVFVLLDEVQLADRAYQHRNLFLTNDGKEKMLTVTIKKKGYRELPLKDIELNTEVDWQKDHLNFLKNNYAKHPFYNDIMEKVMPIYEKEYATLGGVLYDVTVISMELFGITTKLLRQSELEYDRAAKKSDLMLELSLASGCRTYLSGQGAKEYMDEDAFGQKGVNVIYQQFSHPKYVQMNTGDPSNFVIGMNALDVLFNIGADRAKELLNGI